MSGVPLEETIKTRLSTLTAKNKRRRNVEDRLKDIQHEILVAIASGDPLANVMAHLCARAEEVAPNAVCSVLTVDQDGRMHPLAAPSLPDSYSRTLDGVAIGPMAGSCGSAAFLGEPGEVVHIATDARWDAFRDGDLALSLTA